MIPFAGIFEALIAAHGPQRWWPAEDRFEIMVGALLVQRTAWRNVETAIRELKGRELVDPTALKSASLGTIEECIRTAGTFRTKAARLIGLARFVLEQGGLEALDSVPTPSLRRLLLEVDGIGPETADAILLYAFDRPVVVIDAYLRRLVIRLTGEDAGIGDAGLRASIAQTVGDVAALNELHALVVAHGKAFCRKRPRCAECPIRKECRTGLPG